MTRIVFTLLLVGLILSCQKQGTDPFESLDFHVELDNASIPVYVRGNVASKTFVLMVHGAGSFGLSFRDGAFTDLLEKEYAVIYFDQRTQSMSESSFQSKDGLMNQMVNDIDAIRKVIHHVYGEDLSMFMAGHSWGGLLSGLSVISHQESYRGWINIDGLMDMSTITEDRKQLVLQIAEEQSGISIVPEQWLAIKREAEESETYDEVLGILSSVVKLIREEGLVNSEVSRKKVINTLLVNNPLSWQSAALLHQPVKEAIEQQTSLVEDLKDVTIPSLFIYGKYDVSVPPENGIKGFEALGSEYKSFEILDKSIHHPFDTEPDKFGILVKEFVEQFK